jgi:hypothetical protein
MSRAIRRIGITLVYRRQGHAVRRQLKRMRKKPLPRMTDTAVVLDFRLYENP